MTFFFLFAKYLICNYLICRSPNNVVTLSTLFGLLPKSMFPKQLILFSFLFFPPNKYLLPLTLKGLSFLGLQAYRRLRKNYLFCDVLKGRTRLKNTERHISDSFREWSASKVSQFHITVRLSRYEITVLLEGISVVEGSRFRCLLRFLKL